MSIAYLQLQSPFLHVKAAQRFLQQHASACTRLRKCLVAHPLELLLMLRQRVHGCSSLHCTMQSLIDHPCIFILPCFCSSRS